MEHEVSKLDELILLKVEQGKRTFGQLLTGQVYMEALKQSIEQGRPIQRVLEGRLNALSARKKIHRVESGGSVGWCRHGRDDSQDEGECVGALGTRHSAQR